MAWLRSVVSWSVGGALCLVATAALAEPPPDGRVTRTGFAIGSCQVASMDVGYHFQVLFDPQIRAGIKYWVPAGEDCEYQADLALQVEHAGETKWVLFHDTLYRRPRTEIAKGGEIGKGFGWDDVFCDLDGSNCLPPVDTKRWWKDGFKVVSFDFPVVKSSTAGKASGAARPQPSATTDWAPKVEWHPTPLPPSSPKPIQSPEQPEAPPPRRLAREPEEAPAREIQVAPAPEITSYEDSVAGQTNDWERALKDSIANSGNPGPSPKLEGTGLWSATFGTSPIGKRMLARMDGLLLPLYIGLGAGVGDVAGKMTYLGDASKQIITDASWGPLLTFSLGLSVLPPLCKWVSGAQNCSGAALALVGEALFHSVNVDEKGFDDNFMSGGPELYVQVALSEHVAVTSHLSYRWLMARSAQDDFDDSGLFFDLGIAYLDAGGDH